MTIDLSEIRSAKILIVDDQEANVALLTYLLRGAGYEAVTATQDSREVAGLYRKHGYDIVLLDLNMPHVSGFEVIEALKAIESGGYLPILAVTAEPAHKIRALEAGAKDFVSKPFDNVEVLTRVHNMLEVRLLHKTLRAENRDLLNELAHMSRVMAMGEMAAALSHELNQPLAAIANDMNGCRRLLQQLDFPQAVMLRDALERAAGQALRAGQIISRLRQFVARGETDLQVENLATLVEEASSLARIGHSGSGLRVAHSFGSLPVFVRVDKIQIQQVILNLARNAIEAMADMPRRDLTISIEPAASGLVAVAVADSGAGIAPQIAEQLFQPFVTTKAQGMGVGLAISRTIVEAHGGRLIAEPNPGGGTIFRLTLKSIAEGELADDA
jgi:C4-dicarboxylate-specific signal transduction histidine kinase